MSTVFNDFEGITPSGTAVTTGNSGGTSGTAFNGIAGTGTHASDSTRAAHGSLSLHVQTPGSGAVAAYWSTSLMAAATTGRVYFRFYAWYAANPAVSHGVMGFYATSSASTLCGQVQVTAAGKVGVTQATGGAPVFTTSASIPLSQWFRVEGWIASNGSTSAGQCEIRLFTSPDAAVPDETQTSAASQNFGTQVWSVAFGQFTGTASVVELWLDDLAASTDGYQGPSAAAGTVTLAGSAAGRHAGSGARSQAVTAASSAAGTRSQSGTASRPVTLAGAAAGAKSESGPVTGPVSLAGSAAGARHGTGAPSGPAALAGSAAGQASRSPEAAAGTASLAGTAAGTRGQAGTASRNVTLSGSAAGTAAHHPGTAGGSAALAGTAAGQRHQAGSVAGAPALAASAAGGRAGAGAVSAPLALAGLASGRKAAAASVTAAVSPAGHAAGSRASSGTAAGAVSLAAAARGARPLKVLAGAAAVTGGMAGSASAAGLAGTAAVTSAGGGAALA